MPISRYFKGHGEEVMANMDKTYGPDKAKSVFYALANKKHQTAKDNAHTALSMPSRKRKK